MSEGEKANPEIGHKVKATSHVPLQGTEGVGSEASRTQVLGNTYDAAGTLTTEPSTHGGEEVADLSHVKLSVEANSSVSHTEPTTDKRSVQHSFPPSLPAVSVPIVTDRYTDINTDQVGYPHHHHNLVQPKSGPEYDSHNPPSGPEYDGRPPPSGPGYDRHHQQFWPHYEWQHPPSGPRYDGHNTPSGPGYDRHHPPSVAEYDGRPPPSRTIYDGHNPPSRPGYDVHNTPSGPGYDRHHPPSGQGYDSHNLASGPEYDGHHPQFRPHYEWQHPPPGWEYDRHHLPSGFVMPHTMQQQQMCPFPIQSTHKPCHSSTPSKSVTSQAPSPSQASTVHPGPSAASTWGRKEAGYPQAARPPHHIMPTHTMGQYGHGGSPGYGTQSPSPEVPSLSKRLPHQTGCPETSSTPSSDNEAEQVIIQDEFRVLVENASSSTQVDVIQNFLEAKTKLSVEAVLPGARTGSFLVTFTEKPDIGELKSCFMKRPIEDSWLKVSHVLQSACVKVTSLMQDTTDDSIKFYFMNRRKSDGGDVRTVTRSPDGTGAIVHFYDPEVARRVCARTHKLHMTDVVVTFHHQLLEPWGSKDEPSHGTSPVNTGAQQGPRSNRSSGTSGRGNLRSVNEEPAATSRSTTKVAGKAQPGRPADPPEGTSRSVIIKTLDVCVLDFLWKSAPGQNEFVKYMKETLHCSVRFIPQPENRVMLLVEHSGPVHACSAWKATIEKEVSEYVSTYLKVECLRTSVPECLLGDILKAVNPILKSNPSLVRLNHGKKNTDLIICGFRGKVDDVTFQILKVKQSAKPVSPPRTESCQLKQFQARYLSFSKVKDRFPKVTTRIDTETGIFTFEGPSADVIAAKLACLKVAQNLVLEVVTFKSQEATKVLGSHETTDFIQTKLNDARCVWELGEKEVRIYAETGTDAKKGRMVVETSLTESTVAIDTSTSALLSKAEWREKRAELLEAHPGKLELVLQKRALLIVCTSDIGGHVREEVEQFFSRNTLRSKSLPLEPSTAKFLNMFKSNEIRSMEGKLDNHHVKVIVEEGSVCCELRISGYQQGFVEAEKRLNQMTSQIFSKTHKICLPGIEEFFVKGKGRELLSAVEQNEKCIIEAKDKSPEKKEKKMREMKRWDIPSGGVLSVILGDM